jgi:nonribosomal peptide synthetase protein VioO
VRAAAVRDWSRLVPDHVRLLNTYGQTETVLITHAADIGGARGRHLAETDRVPIGRRLPHIDQVVLPTSSGRAVGELLIGGSSVAVGYHGRAADTAGRFVPAPGDVGARLFRTGDLVETMPGGEFAYLGRSDRQLKIRGFRVEPEGVERSLLAHPRLRAAAVWGVDHPEPGTRLEAAVVPSSRSELTELALTEWLATRVEAHLLPRRIHIRTALPLLPNGKVDYAMLRSVDGVPSLETLAAQIAVLAGEVLNRAFRPEEDFFQAGGDSLTATRLISRIYRACNVELTFVDVFEQRTPNHLARLVLRATEAKGRDVTG